MIWDRDKLLMELVPYSPKARPSTPELQKYCDFYKINYAEDSKVTHAIGWIDAGDFRVSLQTFKRRSAKGTVLLVHGYFDHAGLYGKLIRYLLDQGFSVAIYDLPGHGLSTGVRTVITHFQQYQSVLRAVLDQVTATLPGTMHAVAQSTGAAITMDYLSQVSDAECVIDKAVLLAPLVRIAEWKKVNTIYGLVNPLLKRWPRSFSVNSSDLKFVDFLKTKDPLQSRWLSVSWVGAMLEWVKDIETRPSCNRPVTIVQGELDTTVDWRYNRSVINRLFKQVRTVYVQDGRHHMVNESPAIREQVFKAVKAELMG